LTILFGHIAPHWSIFQWFHQLFWPESGQGYAFTSSIGSTFFIGSFFALAYRKLVCQTPWCLRIGHHQTASGHHLCRKHHPDLPNKKLSLEELHEFHRRAIAQGASSEYPGPPSGVASASAAGPIPPSAPQPPSPPAA